MDTIVRIIRGILGIIALLVVVVVGCAIMKIIEEWPERREKRGAIKCPKCGREMRLTGNNPESSDPPWLWWCGICDYYVDILPDKFKKKRQKARDQLNRQGFTFVYSKIVGGEELYTKKGYEASLNWAENIRIFDLELEKELKELYEEGGDKR